MPKYTPFGQSLGSNTKAGQLRLATNAETTAGTDDTIAVSAADASSIVAPSATTSVAGIVVINDDGTLTGATDNDVPTSLATKTYADSIAVAGAPDATTAQKGILELATDAEAIAVTVTDKAVVPSNLDNVFAEPPAIGGTTAAAGSFTTLTTTGAIASTGGDIVLGSDNAANKVDIGLGTTARDINIANSAAAHTIGIGSVTGACEIAMAVGTGNFVLTGAATSDITLGTGLTGGSIVLGATGNTGLMTISPSTGIQQVDIANADGKKTINIGDGVDGNDIDLGNGINTSAQTIDVANAASGADSTVNVLSGNGTAGTQTFNVLGGTRAGVCNISAGAAAHVTTIGSSTGVASVDILVGTGNFTLEGAATSTYGISTSGADTGTISIGTGTGAQTLNLMTGGTGAKTVNIASGAIGNLVTIGTVTAAASLDLLCGTGNFTLEGNVASTYEISSTGVNTGTCKFASGTGARTVEIAGGGTGAKTVNIAAAASADLVTIGTSDGAGSLDLACGTGNFTLEGATASTYEISSTGANTGTVKLASGTGARTVEIAGGGTGIKTVNIAAAATADVVTIGDATGAGSMALAVGTGNFTLEGATASTYEISSTGVNTGTCKFASGTGARTVEIAGGGTGIKTVNIAAAATADVVTIGTTDGAGSLTLAAGTGDITMSGTVKEINAEFLFSSGTDLTVTQSPLVQSNATTGGVPTGVDGDVNLLYMQDGSLMEQFIIGTQTIIAPRMSANGLAIELDNTNAEGAEYNFGARNNAKHAYTIGTSAAFFVEATITVADVSGCAPLMVGFRKVEANNKVLANYTDYFCAGINTATSATNVTLLDELNGGGQTATDSTDAWTGGDGGTTTIRVLVSAAGVCTYTIDGGAPSATNAVTFDNADVVMPMIHFLNGADVAGEVALTSFKCGFQA